MLPASLELLQNMPIFGAVHEDALQVLLEQTRPVRVAAGRYFFHERDVGEQHVRAGVGPRGGAEGMAGAGAALA